MNPESRLIPTRHGEIFTEDRAVNTVREKTSYSLIFLHGGASNLRHWDGVIAKLDNRCIAIDLPGHGITPIDPVSFGELGEAFLDLIEELDVRNPVLIGHSFGGLAAVVAASESDGSYQGVLALDPWLSNTEVRHGHDNIDSVLQGMYDMTWPWRKVQDLEAEVEREVQSMTTREDISWLRSMVRWGYRKQVDGEFVRYPRLEDEIKGVINNWSIDIDEAYSSISCPLAIALAGDDKRRLERRSNIVDSYARHARIDSISFDCGHDIPGYKPRELANYIQQWTSGLGG